MKRFIDEMHKIKIIALFQKSTKSYTTTGMTIHEDKRFLVIKCHEHYYELDISPLPFGITQKIFHIDEIENIKSYMHTRKMTKYSIYIPEEQELKKYQKKVRIGKKDFFSDNVLLANSLLVIDCAEDLMLMLDEKKLDLFRGAT